MNIARYKKPSKSKKNHSTDERPAVADRHLVAVPPETFKRRASGGEGLSGKELFEVAVWLRTPSGLAQPLQLLLRYSDDVGEHELFLDRCNSGAHRTFLLTGCFSVPIAGQVRAASLVLKSVAQDQIIILEEWHLAAQQAKPRLKK